MKKVDKPDFNKIDKSKWQLSGYVQATNLIKAKILNKLGPIEYVVYLTILSHRYTGSITAYPSVQLIADECGISKRSVEESIDKLYKNGFLLINSGRQNINNNYYFPQEEFHKGHENDVEVQIAKRRKGKNKKKESKGEKELKDKVKQLEKENSELKKNLIDSTNPKDVWEDEENQKKDSKEIKTNLNDKTDVKQKELLSFFEDPDYDPFTDDDDIEDYDEMFFKNRNK